MRGVVFCCLVFLTLFCACTVGREGRRISRNRTPQRWALQKTPYNSIFTCECRIDDKSDDRRRPCRIKASCLNMSSVCLEKCQSKTSKYDDDKRKKKICCKENNNSSVLEVTMTYTALSAQDKCPDSTGTVETFIADCTTVSLDQDCRGGKRHRHTDDRRFRGNLGGRGFGTGGGD